MNSQGISYAALAVFVGALFPIQSAANAYIGRGIGGPIAATIVSFASGLIVLLLVNALVFHQFPSFAGLRAQPFPLLWLGGAIGVVFLSANVFLAPRLGAAATLCLVIAGQVIGAMTIDKLGLFAFPLREFTVGRVGGALLVLVGAILVRLG